MSNLYNGTSFIHLNFQILCMCIHISFCLAFAAMLLSLTRPLSPMECLLCFLCLWKSFMFHSRILSLIRRRHHYQLRASNFDLYTAFYPLNCNNTLSCYTNCDKGHRFIMVISSVSRDTHTCCRAFSSGTVTTRVY